MRILLIADLHLVFFKNPLNIVKRINQFKTKNGIDLTLSLGDLTQGTWAWKKEEPSVKAFLSDPNLYYVLGNHDLWEEGDTAGQPDEPLVNFQKMINLINTYQSHPLENSMNEDFDTFYRIEDTIILGSMGFPCFSHPLYVTGKNFYDKNFPTNDSYHFDIRKGWLHYTIPMVNAFEKRLKNALVASEGIKTVLICSHYPILEGQSILKCNETFDAYYFGNCFGMIVREQAKKHPDKQFYCFCGHSHSHCRGELNQIEDNIKVYGVRSDYSKLVLKGFDIIDGDVTGKTISN